MESRWCKGGGLCLVVSRLQTFALVVFRGSRIFLVVFSTYPRGDTFQAAAAGPSPNCPCICIISLRVWGEYRPMGELYCPPRPGGGSAAGPVDAAGLTGLQGFRTDASSWGLGTWNRYFFSRTLNVDRISLMWHCFLQRDGQRLRKGAVEQKNDGIKARKNDW